MFGRKANRRRTESRLARAKLPTFGHKWLRRLRAVLALPIAAVALYGALQGVRDRNVASAGSQAIFEACRAGEFGTAERLREDFLPVEDLRDAWGPATPSW